MELTLLLNSSYEPLKVINWQKAMILWAKGRVEVIEEHDAEKRSVSFTFRIPAVVRLLRFVRVRRRPDYVPFTRANIYARDNHECQYCSTAYSVEELTFDHVIPSVQGGKKDWSNIVTACVDCNREKGGRTPQQAGMRLRRVPVKPKSTAALRVSVGIRLAPATWREYLYWSVELDQE